MAAGHPFPEMVEIFKANREHVTAAAIFTDGELTSGSMPPDDYKLVWISVDGWMAAGKFFPEKSKKL